MAGRDGGTALVVGASRGLGLGLARELRRRGWSVVATERAGRPSADLHALRDAGDGRIEDGRLEIETVDVAVSSEIAALVGRLSGRRFDLVFVNAGIMDDRAAPVGSASDADWARVMNTNALGPLRVIEALDGGLAPGATVAAMSSGLGSVAGNTSGGYEVYRASKAALNTLLRSYAVRAGGRTVLCVSPGWVRTDMGGAGAALDVETSVRGIVDMLERRRGTGGVAFVDHRDEAVPW